MLSWNEREGWTCWDAAGPRIFAVHEQLYTVRLPSLSWEIPYVVLAALLLGVLSILLSLLRLLFTFATAGDW